MKKRLLGLILVCNCFCYSQELINYFVEPHTPTSLVIHTTVFKETAAEFASFEADVVDDTILVKLCYLFGSSQTITIDQQEHIVNLPNSQDSYTVTYELYGDGDNEFPCDMSNLVDTGVVTINFPHNPAQTIIVPDDVFEEYLEDFGYGDGIANNDLVRTNKIINLSHLFLNNQYIPLSGTISDLQGIEEFNEMKVLLCSNNNIFQLDLSSNIIIEKIEIDNNNLSLLNLKNGNNENIEVLVTVNNEELFCIEVDNPDEAPYSGWIVDNHTGFSEDCSLGVVDINSSEINIFPNPVSNILSLSSSSKLQIQQLIVYNIEGGVVFQENNPINTINVAKYSNGLYFIELKTNHGILLKRFIKQ